MTKKINALQGLRAIAFLFVFLWHLNGYMGITIPPISVIAVTFFVVLSGFFSRITWTKYKNDNNNILKRSFNYSKHKLSKLYFLYFITLLLYIPLSFKHIVLEGEYNVFTYILLFIANILLLQAWRYKNFCAISFAGWYLSILSFLYFLTIPFNKIIDLINKKNSIIKNLVAIIITFCFLYIYGILIANNNSSFYFYVFPLYRIFEYLTGMLLANIYLKISNYNFNNLKCNKFIFTFLEIIFIIISYCLLSITLNCDFGVGSSIINIVICLLIIGIFMLEKGIISKILGSKKCVFLGDLSGELYLIHNLVIAYGMGFFQIIFPHNIITRIISIIIVSIITFIVSCVFHYKWYKNPREKFKKAYFKITGKFKQKKFIHKNFTIISNNCFGGVIYRNNALPYNTPTAGLFFMAEDYIKFVYDIKKYINKELVEISIEDSKYVDYLKQINYNAPIGKIDDIEIMFLHYPTFEEAKDKWDRRKKRINYDKIIYKFSEQNECTYEHLKKFNELKVDNKICFTRNKYPELNTIQFTEFNDVNKEFLDSKEKIFKKYFNIYKYVNDINKNPRILILVSDLSKCNGISSYVMNYFKHLNLEKIKMDFILTSNNIDVEYKKIIDKGKSRIYVVEYDKNVSIFKNIKKIKNFIKSVSNDYNIIHSNLINKGYFYLKYAKKYGIKNRILHSHNTTLGSNSFIKKIINNILKRLTLNKANIYFACSNAAGRYLFNNKKFHIINNAINIENFKYKNDIRKKYRSKLKLNDKIVLLQVGRLDIQKNHIFFVDVMKKIIEKNKKIIWVIVGTGNLEDDIKQKIKDFNLEKNVLFLGVRDDVSSLYSMSDIFVLPSLYEGLPVVAVEAQINGLTCLLSDKITTETKITDNLKFLSLDVDEWTSEILKISSTINRSKSIDIQNFNIDHESKKLEQEYYNILKGDNNDKSFK